jgi:L-fuconolactonase
VTAPRIDGHQHFWRLARGDYAWLTPELGPLYRDFEPEDLEPLRRAAGVDCTIVVQAAATVAETRYLLELADRTPWIAGVVGWIDMATSDAAKLLDDLQGHPAFRGVRPMIQDIPDPDWMLRDELTPAFHELARRSLTFDALVRPEHLPRLLRLLERHPDLRVVVDHGAKPDIRRGAFEPWAGDLRRIAAETRSLCKLSGLATEAAVDWSVHDLSRYVDHLFACFGPDRLVWGSDWPVVDLAGGYARWRAATETLLEPLAPRDRAAVLGANAAAFYDVAPHSEEDPE